MRNAVTWFEIVGADAPALHKFYKDVFGWKLTPPVAAMGNYSMLAEHGPTEKGAGGGIGGDPDGQSRVSVYVEVDDPQKYLDRAQKAGAMVLMPVTTITPDTTIAMFRDPAGNVNGILKANPQRPSAETAARAAARPRSASATKKKTTRTTGAAKKTSAAKKRTTARGARAKRRR